MDCKELLEMLPEYFCGELDREDMTRVTSHLLACEACLQEATELKKVLGMLARVELPVPSLEFCRGLEDRVIAAAKSDEAIPVTMPKPGPIPEPVKAAVPEPKVEPVNAAPVVPAPAPKVIAPKPAPPPVVKPIKVAAPKPVPPPKPKVEREVREPRRPLITSWKWVTRGVLPAAAAILVFIVARNMLITDQSYESTPDSTRAVAEAAPKTPAVAETTPMPAAPAATQEPVKSLADTTVGTVLPPPPPSSTESKTTSLLRGDTMMAGIAVPPASPAPAKEAEEIKTRALERDKDEAESTGYATTASERSQGEKKAAGTNRLEEMAYGSGGNAELPAEHATIVAEGKDKAEEAPTSAVREYRKAKVAAEVSNESYDDKSRLSLVGGLKKDDTKTEFLPEFKHGKVPPKVTDAVYLLDMAGSPSPLVHEEILLLSSDTADTTVADEAVYSEVEQQIPLITDYEVLNTLNSMDETHLDDLKESMVNETGGTK
jgi:hypothetical protein